MAPRRPTRLLEYTNKSSAYPKELLANYSSGELTLIDNNGNEVATNPLSIETSGSGNAVKEVTVSGRKITVTKTNCSDVKSATIGTRWSGTSAPYTQSITVSGISASDSPIVDVDLSSVSYSNKDAVLEAYGKIYRIVTANNSITVYADEKTTTSIPIQLKIIY